MMIVSRRQYFTDLLLAMIVVGGLIFVSTLIANYYVIHLEAVDILIEGLAISAITIASLIFVLTVISSGGLSGYINRRALRASIEKNLIAIGAYRQGNNTRYAILPRIRIKDTEIRIKLNDLRIRDRMEKYINSFSTALPKKFVVEDYYINPDNSEMVISYMDVKDFKHEEYSLTNYAKKVQDLGILELYFDKKHIINANDYPHWIISGCSGSGKTYFVQEIVMQSLFKGWDIVVIDIKRSYGLFKDHIDYVYEIDDVIDKLKDIEKEMQLRLADLQPKLDRNPRTLAVDVGYKPKLVLIEEYIALKSALDKKEREDLERIVKSISVLARQANIHIFLVMQSASVENVNASTRHNFSKVLFGNAQSNILISTFGTGIDLPSVSHMEKGEGFIQTDRITVLRVPSIPDIDSFNSVI